MFATETEARQPDQLPNSSLMWHTGPTLTPQPSPDGTIQHILYTLRILDISAGAKIPIYIECVNSSKPWTRMTTPASLSFRQWASAQSLLKPRFDPTRNIGDDILHQIQPFELGSIPTRPRILTTQASYLGHFPCVLRTPCI